MAAILPQSVSNRKKILTLLGNAKLCARLVLGYIEAMEAMDTKTMLWLNISALMRHHFGKENLSELARRAGVGLATCDRIKKKQTSIGTDVLEQIAQVFDLHAWHLLTPNLDPSNPPVIWMTEAEFRLYRRLKDDALALAKIEH